MKRVFKNNYFLVLLLSFLLATFLVLPNIINNNGMFFVSGDFTMQQLPFNTVFGSPFNISNFTFLNDLGSELISSYSFYNCGSLPFLFTNLFSDNVVPYLLGPLLVIKYTLTGLTAFLFLSRYVKNKNYAIIGSLLYAFSGFQICNMIFYHFHDVVLLFPLLLWSLDKFFDGKKGLFALILAISALTNYVFLFGEIVFLIIYIIVKLICKKIKFDKKSIIYLILEFIFGVMISMIILLPSYINTIANPRMGNVINNLFVYPISTYIDIFSSFLIPSDIPNLSTITGTINFQSCEMYIPLFGIIFCLSFVIKKPKSFISIILFILTIMMFIPILNSSFMLFNSEYYARWFYIFSLFISLGTIKVLDEKINITTGLKIYGIIVLIYILLISIYYRLGNIIYITNYSKISFLVAIISVLIVCALYKRLKKSYIYIVLIFISVLISGYNYLFEYDMGKKEYGYMISALSNRGIIDDDEFYRVKFVNCPSNINYMFDLPSIESFNSSINGSLFSFYDSINIDRKQKTAYTYMNYELFRFLGVKYIISCNKPLDNENIEYLYRKDIFNVYKLKNSKSIGFTYGEYTLNNGSIDSSKLAKTLPLNNKEIKEYKDYINADVNGNTKIKDNKIITNIYLEDESLIFYSIPYDENFKVTVNGIESKLININNMLAVLSNKGNNEVVLSYDDIGYKRGIKVTIIGIVLLITYICWRKKNEKSC